MSFLLAAYVEVQVDSLVRRVLNVTAKAALIITRIFGVTVRHYVFSVKSRVVVALISS